MPPIKILNDLYVFALLGSNENAKEEFMRLSKIDKIYILINSEPLARKVRLFEDILFYTPAFGDFVVSSFATKHLNFKGDIQSAQKKTEELFLKLQEKYKVEYVYNSLEGFVYSRHSNRTF